MRVTEKDLFNYVFYRHLLPDEKVKYIETEGLFSGIISFYSGMKDLLIQEVSEVKRLFVLKPNVITVNKGVKSRLAADSANLKRKTEFTTFTDEHSAYFGRLLSSEDKTLLYIISSESAPDKKIKLTIFPSEKTYLIDDMSNPVVLPDSDVTLIHLEEV